jgi:hypothetical protein
MNEGDLSHLEIKKWKMNKINDSMNLYIKMKISSYKNNMLENYQEFKSRMMYIKENAMSLVNSTIAKTKDMKPFLLAYYDFPEYAARSEDWFTMQMYHYFRSATQQEVEDSKKIMKVPKDIMRSLQIFDPEEIPEFYGEPIKIKYAIFRSKNPIDIIDTDWEIKYKNDNEIQEDFSLDVDNEIEDQVAVISTYNEGKSHDYDDLPF